jgi:hypothetical protein
MFRFKNSEVDQIPIYKNYKERIPFAQVKSLVKDLTDVERVDLIEVKDYTKLYFGPNRFALRRALLDQLMRGKITDQEWLSTMNNVYCELQTILIANQTTSLRPFFRLKRDKH